MRIWKGIRINQSDILMDINMPETDGIEAAQKVQGILEMAAKTH